MIFPGVFANTNKNLFVSLGILMDISPPSPPVCVQSLGDDDDVLHVVHLDDDDDAHHVVHYHLSPSSPVLH